MRPWFSQPEDVPWRVKYFLPVAGEKKACTHQSAATKTRSSLIMISRMRPAGFPAARGATNTPFHVA
jgi:hypothetical protein